MNDGAKVFDVREPFFETFRECLRGSDAGTNDGANEVGEEMLDWLRKWEAEVGDAAGDDEKMPDFGRPALPGAGDEGEALAKRLLRRDAEPWALKDMMRCGHEQQLAVLLVDACCEGPRFDLVLG